ncbi:MAG: hypothetical protein MUC92_08825 [Fimbriimonadaceae bacterium]|jgi:DNA-directed RNA polymerase subunit RPC12/RpoP|nr:hypothetical protein [Fimbriimonadaceae bacterium]
MSKPPIVSSSQGQANRFPCAQCGAQLDYAPGLLQLKCPYCGFEQPIPVASDRVVENDFLRFVKEEPLLPPDPVNHVEQCNNCAAQFTLGPRETSTTCPFCGGNVVVAPANTPGQIAPEGLVPFMVDKRQARTCFESWIGTRFWAPNDLKNLSKRDGGLTGVYVPYWTFDAFTITAYTGMKGIVYYRTETYTDREGNVRTRQVEDVHWYPASGVVQVPFDDLLVLACDRLPPQHVAAMRSWQLDKLVNYENAFLSGFQATRYTTTLSEGYGVAVNMMQPGIDRAIRQDIGGDRQQIHSKNSDYQDITFKHILLPIWSGAYRYKGKTWTYLVNGQTGEVTGDSPISPWKVALAVLLGLIVVGFILWLMSQQQ